MADPMYGALIDAARAGLCCERCDFCSAWTWRPAPKDRGEVGRAFSWCPSRKCEARLTITYHAMLAGHVLTDAVAS